MESSVGSGVGDYHAIVLGIGLAATSVTDLYRRSIPNYLTGIQFIAGFGLNIYKDGWLGLSKSASGSMVALAIVWWFYRRGSLGAGDAKLFTAIGAVTGPLAPISIAVYSLAVASAVALAMGNRRPQDGSQPSQSGAIPMAPVFASATAITYMVPLMSL